MDGAPREPPLSTEGVAVEHPEWKGEPLTDGPAVGTPGWKWWENPNCAPEIAKAKRDCAAALKRAAEREREGTASERAAERERGGRAFESELRQVLSKTCETLPYGGSCHDCSSDLSPQEIADGRGGRFCPKCQAKPLCDNCVEGHWDTHTYGTSCFHAAGYFAQREAHARASWTSERARSSAAHARSNDRERASARARRAAQRGRALRARGRALRARGRARGRDGAMRTSSKVARRSPVA